MDRLQTTRLAVGAGGRERGAVPIVVVVPVPVVPTPSLDSSLPMLAVLVTDCVGAVHTEKVLPAMMMMIMMNVDDDDVNSAWQNP